MKSLLFSMFVLSVSSIRAADVATLEAQRRGAEVNMPLLIVDDNGNPVDGATVLYGFYNGGSQSEKFEGSTDENGCYLIRGRCKYYVSWSVVKKGFYMGSFRQSFASTKERPAVIDGKWQPWGEERRIVLKRKLNPIAMSTHRFDRYKPPVFDEWLGFDLSKCLWCPPYGEGEHADVLMRFTKDYRSPFVCASTFEVSFTNNPYAGFVRLAKDMNSEMKSIRVASTNNSTYSETYFKQVKEVDEKKRVRHEDRLPEDEYLVFRTRTKVDDQGRLLSAHYGKIYGPFEYNLNFAMEARGFYFNTTANDPNLEDELTHRESEMYFYQRK